MNKSNLIIDYFRYLRFSNPPLQIVPTPRGQPPPVNHKFHDPPLFTRLSIFYLTPTRRGGSIPCIYIYIYIYIVFFLIFIFLDSGWSVLMILIIYLFIFIFYILNINAQNILIVYINKKKWKLANKT